MTVVRAAGGVVVRRDCGQLQVLLVHRPRYDDWTLPKGKLEPGETEAEGALREVEEETGLKCDLGQEIATTSYTDSRGRPKTVRYWEMHPREGSFTPHDEVDDARWLSLPKARRLLSYDRDRDVLDRLPSVT
jgi:8-oxo-dGTP diphosphatase